MYQLLVWSCCMHQCVQSAHSIMMMEAHYRQQLIMISADSSGGVVKGSVGARQDTRLPCSPTIFPRINIFFILPNCFAEKSFCCKTVWLKFSANVTCTKLNLSAFYFSLLFREQQMPKNFKFKQYLAKKGPFSTKPQNDLRYLNRVLTYKKILSEMGVAPPHKRFSQFSALIKQQKVLSIMKLSHMDP